jgi:DNA-directed RNA polymerase specialized sigma24 family protein
MRLTQTASRPATSAGVPPDRLRAAVALANARGDDHSVRWSYDQWSRLWVRLTPAMQEVVYLHAFVGLTLAEAADQLGVRRASAAATLARAADRIRDALPLD